MNTDTDRTIDIPNTISYAVIALAIVGAVMLGAWLLGLHTDDTATTPRDDTTRGTVHVIDRDNHEPFDASPPDVIVVRDLTVAECENAGGIPNGALCIDVDY